MPNKKVAKRKITLEKLVAIMDEGFAQAKKERGEGFAQAKKERGEGFAQAKKEMDEGFAQAKKERGEGFAQAKKDNEDLAVMVQNGFDEVNGRITLLERGQQETNDRLEVAKREQEEIKLRLTNVAYKFEIANLEKRTQRIEDIALVRRRKS